MAEAIVRSGGARHGLDFEMDCRGCGGNDVAWLTLPETLWSFAKLERKSVFNFMDIIHGSVILSIGIAAALCQVIGYLLYLFSTTIKPQLVSWLMWGGTTWIVALVEAETMIRQHGGWAHVPWEGRSILLLPVICGILAGIVAIRCWLNSSGFGLIDRWDKLALGWGIGLFAGYLLLLGTRDSVSDGVGHYLTLTLLVLINLVTVLDFMPILRSTFSNASNERPGPWVVWSMAYLLLLISSVAAGGGELLIYPIVNLFLHGLMVWFSAPLRRGFASCDTSRGPDR